MGSEAVGTYAQCLEEASAQAVLFAHDPPARAPFVFFDLETTGLSGGAGTQAFLVGCGRFDAEGGFVTRQFVLTRHADERPLLETVAGELARAGALVSFNGKSFDAPLLETRYLFHRLEWSVRCLPHVDVLHPARQFWKPVARPLSASARGGFSRATADYAHPCSLIALERRHSGHAGAPATCPASRFRAGTSNSSARRCAIRSPPCSSTIASICCRWRR